MLVETVTNLAHNLYLDSSQQPQEEQEESKDEDEMIYI
jgi:hypothetical protein